ncbi:MAG TPA: hypothetical protein VHN11_23395 [Xanthobacteraceae bacterium]|jgi:hypothetical protein|nr:hypothetical protein [Xanthobacteraceae bacterium]
MIRFLLRFIGLWLLAAGFIQLIYDGTKTIAGNTLFISRLQDSWTAVHQTSLQALQPAIERTGLGWLWDPVALTALDAPTWLILGLIGAIFTVLGRKKRPMIGYARD